MPKTLKSVCKSFCCVCCRPATLSETKDHEITGAAQKIDKDLACIFLECLGSSLSREKKNWDDANIVFCQTCSLLLQEWTTTRKLAMKLTDRVNRIYRTIIATVLTVLTDEKSTSNTRKATLSRVGPQEDDDTKSSAEKVIRAAKIEIYERFSPRVLLPKMSARSTQGVDFCDEIIIEIKEENLESPPELPKIIFEPSLNELESNDKLSARESERDSNIAMTCNSRNDTALDAEQDCYSDQEFLESIHKGSSSSSENNSETDAGNDGDLELEGKDYEFEADDVKSETDDDEFEGEDDGPQDLPKPPAVMEVTGTLPPAPTLKHKTSKGRKSQRCVLVEPGKYNYGGFGISLVDANYICDTCDMRRMNRNALVRHIKRVHLRKKKPQPEILETRKEERVRNQCVQIEPDKFIYAGAIEITRVNEKYACGVCGKLRKDRHSLLLHIRTAHEVPKHNVISRWEVPSVETSPGNFSYGGYPIKYDGNLRKYVCGTCPKLRANKSLSSMRTHVRIEHISSGGVRPKPYDKPVCEQCGKLFASPSSLYTHKQLVHLQDDRLCPICGKILKNEFLLRLHIKSHGQHNECKTCGRQFATHNYLLYHIKRHKGESFPCNLCDEKFPTIFQKRIHLQTVHRGEQRRRLSCSQCDKTFFYKYDLRNHEKLHSGEAFECKSCVETFLNASSLRRHRKLAHKDESTRPPTRICEDGKPAEA